MRPLSRRRAVPRLGRAGGTASGAERLAINVVQSAWKRRESCDSPSIPERMDHHAGPEEVAERQDAVERAVLLLMETLSPRQRAAYVLREGFGCPYDRIAEILHLSVVNRRQQLARAQRRLNGNHRRQQADSVAHRRLVQAFVSAARTGDRGHLERLMRAVGGDRCGRCQRAWPGGRNLVDADVPGPGDGVPDVVGDFPFGLCPSRRVQARRGRRVPRAVASCRNAAEKAVIPNLEPGGRCTTPAVMDLRPEVEEICTAAPLLRGR
ncbi:DNA-directed RNA polymerase specialized sigma24 family protein [Streptomyces canus]|nr:DNA-directed RNA polymerase specialized sigma24 family protein [Streptomyces canus]